MLPQLRMAEGAALSVGMASGNTTSSFFLAFFSLIKPLILLEIGKKIFSDMYVFSPLKLELSRWSIP